MEIHVSASRGPLDVGHTEEIDHLTERVHGDGYKAPECATMGNRVDG